MKPSVIEAGQPGTSRPAVHTRDAGAVEVVADQVTIVVRQPENDAQQPLELGQVSGRGRIALRAAVFGGLLATTVLALLNQRRIRAYAPPVEVIGSPKARRRYARQALRSLDQAIG